ncbi:ADP-ribose pyrophosphatase [Kosakonia oryziphila]|uniref:ADP-ribose pyrophosphatase n=1 Tax=Kosakonia oryziphila TaxID=1005667 RepID=A0A1C4ANM9_9ENTR|nr:ADP-ribose pyrophosphatase [Kosakonia oryziphila]
MQKVFAAWMSPGSVSEKLHFVIAEYDDSKRTGNGGGVIEEGEDIEVVEMDFASALAAIRTGDIADGKTIMLLQHLAREGIL